MISGGQRRRQRRAAASLLQGPFTKEQLSGWRCALPMDLPLKYRDAKQPGVASLELAKVRAG